MISKDLKEVQRILKRNKIGQPEIATLLAREPTYVSKIFNGHRSLTKSNFDTLNKAYGHLVTLDESLIGKEGEANSVPPRRSHPQVPDQMKLNQRVLGLVARSIESVLREEQKTVEGMTKRFRAIAKDLRRGIVPGAGT